MLVAGDSTEVTTHFALRQSSGASAGQAATGLTITDFDLQYVRSGAAPAAKVDATALVATDSAWDDNKAIEIDATDQPGLYRIDWPDAAFAAGVREVILSVKVATAFTEHLRVEIDGVGDAIWAKKMTELGAVPGVTGTVLAALEWLFQLARNKGTQTSTTKTLRNDADDGDIATAAISSDGTTFTREEWS